MAAVYLAFGEGGEGSPVKFQACDREFFRLCGPLSGNLGLGGGQSVRGCDTPLCCEMGHVGPGVSEVATLSGCLPWGCQRLRQSLFSPLFVCWKPGFSAECLPPVMFPGLSGRFLGFRGWRGWISANFWAIFPVGRVVKVSEVATLHCVWIGLLGCR